MNEQENLEKKGHIEPTTNNQVEDYEWNILIIKIVVVCVIVGFGILFWGAHVNTQDAIETRQLKVAYLETVVLDSPITEIEYLEPNSENNNGLYFDTFNVKTKDNAYYQLNVYDQSVNGAYNFVSAPWDEPTLNAE